MSYGLDVTIKNSKHGEVLGKKDLVLEIPVLVMNDIEGKEDIVKS